MPPHITLTRQAPCTSSSWPVNILYWILITLLYIGPSDLCSTPFKPPTRIHVPCRGGHPWADHGYTELHDCEGAVPAPALGYRVSGNNYFVDSYISNIRNQLACSALRHYSASLKHVLRLRATRAIQAHTECYQRDPGALN